MHIIIGDNRLIVSIFTGQCSVWRQSVFLRAKVKKIEAGAVYRDSVLDWWVHIEVESKRQIKLFDYEHVIDPTPEHIVIKEGEIYDFLILAFSMYGCQVSRGKKLTPGRLHAEIVEVDWQPSDKVRRLYSFQNTKNLTLARTRWGKILLNQKYLFDHAITELKKGDCFEWEGGRFDLIGLRSIP